MFRRILGIGALVLGLASCDVQDTPNPPKPDPNLVTLVGQPIGVESGTYDTSSYLSFILIQEDKKSILCKIEDPTQGHSRVIDAAALVKAESEDLDDETIEVVGVYQTLYGEKNLYLNSVKVGQYKVEFRK